LPKETIMTDGAVPPSAPLRRGAGPRKWTILRRFLSLWVLRKEAPLWQTIILGALCIALCLGIWQFVTWGESESRYLSPTILPSPAEAFAFLPTLWSDEKLWANALVTIRRVLLGFGLAALVGIPLGVLCGCFDRLNSFFEPLTIFGRNIPIAALLPLLVLLGTGEREKVVFIFIACVAFVVADTARAIADVSGAYMDTAYTLGASRWQVVLKVLVPLAMPSIFDSLRLLFGLAFGYIMLAEGVKASEDAGGLGYLINLFEKRGHPEGIILLLLLIPALALVINRVLFWIQRQLFPYRYGGSGYLNQLVRLLLHGWDDVKGLFRRRGLQPQPVAVTDPTSPKKS